MIDKDLLEACKEAVASLQSKGMTSEANVILWGQREFERMQKRNTELEQLLLNVRKVAISPRLYAKPMGEIVNILSKCL